MFENIRLRTDVLVIGSGGAGMRAAIAVSNCNTDVMIISQGKIGRDGATITAAADVNVDSRTCKQMFNLPGDDEDSKEIFFKDTVVAGNYLNNQKMVKTLVEDIPCRVSELFEWGAKPKHLYSTPGHQYPRGIWIDGQNFSLTLSKELKKHKIKINEDYLVLDLAVDNNDNNVIGAYALDLKSGSFVNIGAKAVIIATGGAMGVFYLTTCPSHLTGDGMAMAYRAGAELIDMEFPQFILAPCAPPAAYGSIYPFALLMRVGAHLYNNKGERFMMKWDPMLMEQTTRDLLAVGAQLEITQGRGGPNGGVWVSIKHLPDNLIDYFQEWYGKWLGKGKYKYNCFDIRELFEPLENNGIEVKPTAHFWSGGIRIDSEGNSSVPGLFAAGEVTGGLHGANRLSGNAMGEILVWGFRSGIAAANYAKKISFDRYNFRQEKKIFKHIENIVSGSSKSNKKVTELKKELQNIASKYLEPARNATGLKEALKRCKDTIEEVRNIKCNFKEYRYNLELIDAISLENIHSIIELTAYTALKREESRGSHYRIDFPKSHKRWLKNLCIKKSQTNKPEIYEKPIIITNLYPEEESSEK